MQKRQLDVIQKQVRKCCVASAKSNEQIKQLEQIVVALLGSSSRTDPGVPETEECGREDFTVVFAPGLARLGLLDREVSAALNVSRATVTRWRRGRTAPTAALRQHVLAWLKSRLEGIA